MIHLEKAYALSNWRWKPVIHKGIRTVKFPWPAQMPAYTIRWGFWSMYFYSDKSSDISES